MPSCTSLKEQRQAVRIKCARLLQPAKQPQSRKNGCVVKGWELHSLRIRSRKLQHVCRFTLLWVKLLHGQIIGALKHNAGRKSQMRANSQQTALPSCLIICISSGKAAENWQTTLSSLITGGGCKHSLRHCVSHEEWFSTKGPFPPRKGFLQCALRGVALECQRFACAHRDDSSGNRMYPLALKLATRTKSWFRDLTLPGKPEGTETHLSKKSPPLPGVPQQLRPAEILEPANPQWQLSQSIKHILVTAQAFKTQRIYKCFLQIVCPSEFKELSKLKGNTDHIYFCRFQTSSPALPRLFILCWHAT